MGSSFNPQILVEKLTKLNNSQASIETLSHWCIFHMHKAKHVVETWARQFHSSPREQRLAFLYLANDILQNSRRKGSEFVGEFWKVLPEALREVIDNGDEFGRNSAMRLIGIWEDRKVFGSRGQVLKEELLGRQLENSRRNGKNLDSSSKLRHPIGSTVDKIVSGYHVAYGGKDEDVILGKCSSSISFFEKVDKEIRDNNSGKVHGPAFLEEVQGQYAALRESIEQLVTIESSKASLVSHLREALQEQEAKLEHVKHQLQVARSQSETADNLCQQLVRASNAHSVTDQNSKEASNTVASQSFVSGDREQTAPSMYTRQVSFPEKSNPIEEDPRKSAAAAIAAKLTASTSSAQMLSYVLSSLASEGVIDYQPEKRARHENEPYIPTQSSQQSQPPYQPSDSYQQDVTTTQLLAPIDPPPLPSSPPPMAPLPPPYSSMPPYIPTAGPMNGVPYGYGMSQQQLPPLQGFSPVGTSMSGVPPFGISPTNSYQSYQGSEGNRYVQQPSSMPMAPMSRQ
ncbi:Regulation of nuclear pre-mRNA domain-containing protein 1B [Linum perenne]